MSTLAPHSPAAPTRWRRLALATGAALALHAVLLGRLPDVLLGADPAAAAPSAGAAPLWVRHITAARQADQPLPNPPAATPPAAPAARPRALAQPRHAMAPSAAAPDATASGVDRWGVAPADAASVAAAAASAPAATAVTTTETPDATSVASSVASSVATPATDAGAHTASRAAEAGSATPPPQYRTQPAPAATLLFDFKRGLAGGQAVLQWRPDISAPSHTGAATGSYSLTLQAQAFGISVAAWNSSGRFDAAGLAPDRYAESRRSREVRATHFQRAADKISFSAQVTEYPLPAGVQDRSSWLLQLGAILQAHPELAQPGAQVSLVVVGTRGAPEPWLFTVQGRVALATVQGRAALALDSSDELTPVANVVHLIREPRRPYDTRASVWLDPARHHLPVKVQMWVQGTGEGQELELRQLTLP